MIEYSRDSWVTWLSVWIIRYCYSCGASCSALLRAMCKSWMTVKKANDKLMDFCRSTRKLCGCARCLLGDICNIIVAHYCLVFLSFILFFIRHEDQWACPNNRGAMREKEKKWDICFLLYSTWWWVLSEMVLRVWKAISTDYSLPLYLLHREQ